MNTPHQKIVVTKTRLNTAPFIEKSITVLLVITNSSASYIHRFALTDEADITVYEYTVGSAALFYKGIKYTLKAKMRKNKITLGGIFVPPRENVFVFYRLHKLTD